MKKILDKTIDLFKNPIVILILFSALFFARPLLTNQGISPSDLIYIFDNYKYLAEEDYKPSNELLSDQTTQFEVWKMYAREEIREGRLPIENPYQANGAPLIGNDQSALFFPTNIIFYLLPINFATTLGVIIRVAFAAIGAYFFLKAIGIRKNLSVLGGVAFAFAGFNIVWLNHPHANVSIFLPWLFWATHMLTEPDLQRKPRIKYSILMALFVTLQFLGGHVETSFHICFATGVYFAYRILSQFDRTLKLKQNLKVATKTTLLYLVPITIGLIFSLIQLIPFLIYLEDSYALEARGASTNSYGQPYLAAATWVVPNIFGNPKDDIYTRFFPAFSLSEGVELVEVPLTNFNESVQGYAGFMFILLAPLAILVSKRRKLVGFLVIFNLFIVLVSLRIPPIFQIVTSLPLFDVSANHRLLVIFGFINIILGSIVLEGLISERDSITSKVKILNKSWLYIIPGGIILLGLILSWQSQQDSTMIRLILDKLSIDKEILKNAKIMLEYSLNAFGVFLILFGSTVTFILLFLQRKITEKVLLISLILIIMVDIFIYAFEFNPTYDLNKRYPITPGIEYLQENTSDENILFVGFTLPPNLATAYKLHDLRNYDAMQEKDFTKDFHAAYNPAGAWETINTLPSIETVKGNNENYNFDVKYIAIGAISDLGEQAKEFYSEGIVYEGEDFIIVQVDSGPMND